jgi:N-acetylglucosaminyldiphosphoundecaprenol N-acetyl-beta-D-mannosaminyltransferase
MKDINVLGIRIDGLSMSEVLMLISKTIKSKNSLRIVTANPEILFRAEKDTELRNLINRANLVLPDGVGIVWAAKMLEGTVLKRITGIDLASEIIAAGDSEGWKVFLLGSAEGVAEEAALSLNRKFRNVRFMTHHGYFTESEEDVVAKIRSFAPDVLLAGLGAPKQEQWLDKYPDLAYVNMGVGGTFDVFSGRVERAPDWIRRFGMEWFYRLLSDPLRLRRQKILPLFVLKVLKQKMQK